jgi:2',3'-cyclic-nucleotide 2'-phosphodiesterase (5'-nucleotidase family)
LRPYLDETLTTATEPLPATNAARRETALANLLADAVRAQAKTDIGLIAPSQMDANGLPAGPVRVRDLYALMGAYTRQHLVVARVTGERLRQLFETATENGNIRLHPSGVRLARTPLLAVSVNGQPLNESTAYTVAASAYLVQEFLLNKPGVEIVSDDVAAPTLRDAAITYLRGHAPLANRTDGRLFGS